MFRPTFLALALGAALAVGAVALPVRADDPPSPGAPAPAKAVDLENTTCPVTGKPVAAGITETVNGTVVHFCCPRCPAKYRANPAAYEDALRADPAVAKRMDAARATAATPTSMREPDKAAVFHDAMRALWEDHVLWTRLFVVSAIADLPDKDATTKRLLRNQEDLGNAIRPYYGEAAGMKLTALLKDHITTAADLVGALKANDTAKADAARKRWSANADEIAAFLSGANPTAWPLDAAKSMMHDHLGLTTDEVAARLKGDWDADVAAYDKVRAQALEMADMLSDGIVRQFPDKFR